MLIFLRLTMGKKIKDANFDLKILPQLYHFYISFLNSEAAEFHS